MTQPTKLTGSYYAVEVPNDTIKIELIDKESWPLCLMCYVKDEEGWFKPGVPVPVVIPPGSWTLIGHVNTIPEDLATTIVERQGDGYKDYSGCFHHDIPCVTAVDSLRSLLASKGLDPGKVVVVRKGE